MCGLYILLGQNSTKEIDRLNELTRNCAALEFKLALHQATLNKLEERVNLLDDAFDMQEAHTEKLLQFENPVDLKIQSEDDSSGDIGATHEEHEVVQFADGIDDDQDGSKAILDPIHRGLDVSYELNNFFSRPTRIRTYSIPQGESYNIRQFYPWADYFMNPQIKKKLDNYAYIRCNLKLKFVVNSSPFIYGAYCAAYQPLPDFNKQLIPQATTDSEDRIFISQRPNIVVESHKNKGGDLTLPFFYHKDWLPTTEADFEAMGQITIFPYAAFDSANGTATGDVPITVYAWAEDVEITGATVLSVQTDDEYGQGPVERISSKVAGYASYLEDVPFIGPFALATNIGASAVSAIASLFGWTNVPVIENVAPFKNLPYHAFASSEIGVPIDKLTLDPKNELTVDPRVAGLDGCDEMSIKYLTTREAFLFDSTWSQSFAQNQSLARMNVTPTWCVTVSNPNGTRIWETPMGHVSRMFANWRGSIVIRIKLVASPYHQGRLRVSYDPRGDIFAVQDTENVVVTKIIDLSVTDEAEFVIPYMQPQAWQEVSQTFQRDWSQSTTTTYNETRSNGRFEVQVLNPLTGPDATAGVELLFFVRAGDDFEVANPGAMPQNMTPLAIQSADEIVSADGKITYTMGSMTSRPVDVNMVHFGEAIQSVRPVLRRTNQLTRRLGESLTIATQNVVAGVEIAANIYPQQYGYHPRSYYRGQTKISDIETDVSVSKTHPITWMAMCYAGIRGSMHYNYNNISSVEYPQVECTRVLANAPKYTMVNRTVLSDSVQPLPSGAGNSGLSLINERTQNGVAFTVPYMSKYKFAPCSADLLGTGNNVEYNLDENNYMVSVRRVTDGVGPSLTQPMFSVYCGAGTDFTLLYFLGVPLKYSYGMTINGIATGNI